MLSAAGSRGVRRFRHREKQIVRSMVSAARAMKGTVPTVEASSKKS
jgi:hypothetical protein